jgi:hypothetical protein
MVFSTKGSEIYGKLESGHRRVSAVSWDLSSKTLLKECPQDFVSYLMPGMQQGMEQGMQQGMEQGQWLAMQRSIEDFAQKLFPELLVPIKKQIGIITDLAVLQNILFTLCTARTAKEVKDFLRTLK